MNKKAAITDLNDMPFHMAGDYARRNYNIEKGFPLCKRCSGTGNELYSMYAKCRDCDGTGRARPKKRIKKIN